MSDLDNLVDMGFDREKAALALKSGGNLQGAIDYLDRNASKTLSELQEEAASSTPETLVAAPSEEAKSLLCNDCGKSFRSHAAAESHAAKTQHTDFAESTVELAPLTSAEKEAALSAARERAAARKAEKDVEDKKEAKRNEQIKRKATKESAELKEELVRKEQVKEAQAKRREKVADVEAKKRVQAQIAKDKEERRVRAEEEKRRREAQTFPASAVEASVPVGVPVPRPNAAASGSGSGTAHAEARLRLQTNEGNVMKAFSAETTLFEVAHLVKEEKGVEVSVFESTFPRKKWEKTDFGMTLREAGLVPSASIIVR